MSDQTPNLTDVLLAIEKLGGELGQLRSDLMTRLDRYKDALTTICDDIGVNLSRADRAVDGVNSLRTEFGHLSKEVAGIERQVQRLQSEVRQLRGEPG
jgi:hypothetical protein